MLSIFNPWTIAAFALAIIGLIAVRIRSRKNNSKNRQSDPQKKSGDEKSKTPGRKSSLLKGIIFFGILGFAVYAISVKIWSHGAVSRSESMAKEMKKSLPAQAAIQNNQNSSWNRMPIVAPVRAWSETIQINGHRLSTFPSGKIRIMTPDGRILHDQPGVHIEWGELPNGDYKFQSEEKHPIEVQVFVN